MTHFRFFTPLLVLLLLPVNSFGEEKQTTYPESIARYLKRIYSDDQQSLTFQSGDDFSKWQQETRRELVGKLGIDRIKASVGEHEPVVELEEPTDEGDYLRQRGTIETEPDVVIPFWLLKPKGEGPWPLGVFPHGHSSVGFNTYAGLYPDEKSRAKALAEDRDVAVQAVKRGFIAIAPAIRGLSTGGVPDLRGRHGDRPCRAQAMHCLLAGRTAVGERVWDMQRVLDWAIQRDDVDSTQVLMMGNSGGGMATVFTSACDERVTIAVPSSSFAPTTDESGYIFHCDCNMVPGLIELGGLPGVAGLIAPRHLLAVNGRHDSLITNDSIDQAVRTTGALYVAAGHPQRFEHRWGDGGHRFYKDLMWPFILHATQRQPQSP